MICDQATSSDQITVDSNIDLFLIQAQKIMKVILVTDKVSEVIAGSTQSPTSWVIQSKLKSTSSVT
jgi:hypothetical protein